MRRDAAGSSLSGSTSKRSNCPRRRTWTLILRSSLVGIDCESRPGDRCRIRGSAFLFLRAIRGDVLALTAKKAELVIETALSFFGSQFAIGAQMLVFGLRRSRGGGRSRGWVGIVTGLTLARVIIIGGLRRRLAIVVERTVQFDVGPIGSVETFGSGDEVVESGRRCPTGGDELGADAGREGGIERVAEVTVGPRRESILNCSEAGGEVDDSILVGHLQLSEIVFGGALGVFESPSATQFRLEIFPREEPQGPMCWFEKEEVREPLLRITFEVRSRGVDLGRFGVVPTR